jgi:hypothetical protein
MIGASIIGLHTEINFDILPNSLESLQLDRFSKEVKSKVILKTNQAWVFLQRQPICLPSHGVLHVKKNSNIGLSASLEVDQNERIFVLTKAPLGSGSRRNWTISVEYKSMKTYAYTVVRTVGREFDKELRIISNLQGSSFVKMIHVSTFSDKERKEKKGLMMKLCNYGELLDFIINKKNPYGLKKIFTTFLRTFLKDY